MNKNDNILHEIDSIISKSKDNKPKTELGHFFSFEDRAYRKQAINEMFCSLNRDNQNMVLKYMLDIVETQYS